MFKNLHLKILALFAALIFWFFIVSFKNTIKEIQDPIPIQPFNLSENLAVKNSLGNVMIKIGSAKQDFSNIKAGNFQAFVDLKNLDTGNHTVDIQVTTDNKEINIVDILPKNISVLLEKKISKEVPINVLIKGNPEEGYQAGEAKTSEEIATLSGISNMMDTITYASAIIEFTGNETADFQDTIPLVVTGNHGETIEQISVSPKEITITVPIIQTEQTKTVGIKPHFIGKLPEESNVWLSKMNFTPSTIQIKGTKDSVSNIENIETEDIDLDQIKNNTIKRVNLIFPEGISPVNPKETNALLELSLSPIQ